jgi:lipopolysaccharide export system permease protein
MQRYVRYLSGQLARTTLLVTLVLTATVWLAQSLRFVDYILNKGLSVWSFLGLTALLLPSLLTIILPIACFVATLFVYNRMAQDREAVVLQAAGLSRFQLARPALLVAAVVAVVSYSITLYFLPLSYRYFKDLQDVVRQTQSYLPLEEGVFTSPVDGLTVYLRDRSRDGELSGILVHDGRQPDRAVTVMAEKGYLASGPDGGRLILVNGNRQEIAPGRRAPSILYFDRYTVDLSALDTETGGERWRKPNERYITELLNPSDHPDDQANIGRFRSELHERLTWPLYAPVFVLIGLAVLLSGEFRRRGLARRTAIAAAIALAVLVAGLSLSNVIAEVAAAAIFLYAALLVPAVVSVLVLAHRLDGERLAALLRRLRPPAVASTAEQGR